MDIYYLKKCRQAVIFSLFFAQCLWAQTAITLPSSLALTAKIGDQQRQVAIIKPNTTIPILTLHKQRGTIQFGNQQAEFTILPHAQYQTTTLTPTKKHPIQGYVLIQKITPLYENLTGNTHIQLVSNLRYPFIGTTTDKTGKRWYKIRFADQIKYLAASDVELDNGIAVLTYHHILQDQENHAFLRTSTTTSDIAFEKQLATMQALGFESIDLYQLEGYLKATKNLPAKAVAITFDDGLKSIARYGYPLLKKYHFKGTMFAITSRIKYYEQPWNPDGLQFLSKNDYEQMKDVFDWQSHTHFLHRYVNRKPILPLATARRIRLDFERSIRELKQFNSTPIYLSYPFGAYNQTAIEAAKVAGFHLAFTTKIGKVKFGDSPYELKRIYLLRTVSEERIKQLLSN